MKSITFNNIYKKYNNEDILTNFSFEIPGGSFFALLGPSGCGKTTLLRLIGGFESVDKGTIFFNDEDVTSISADKRKVNTVFQNYALFPHLNVFNNIAYGLSIKSINRDVIREKIEKIADSFNITKILFKFPSELSGGQQQRVAIARAIINEPDILLLDEPLSALDFKTREKTLLELVELQKNLKTTFVYVTHDQFEALTVADYMAIMSEGGVIEQAGKPEEIYEEPANSFVALFVGNTNLFDGNIEYSKNGDCKFVVNENFSIDLLDNSFYKTSKYYKLSIRPEKIIISKVFQSTSWSLKGVIKSIAYYGRSTEYIVILENNIYISVFEQNKKKNVDNPLDYNDKVFIYWNIEDNVLLKN